MDKDPSAEAITAWLKGIGKDRPWLARELGISEGSLDNSFSKGFSRRSLLAVKRLMNPASNSAGLDVTFTVREFDRIIQAMEISGHQSLADFYHDTIIDGADQIIAQEKRQGVIISIPHLSERVAEEAPKVETHAIPLTADEAAIVKQAQAKRRGPRSPSGI